MAGKRGDAERPPAHRRQRHEQRRLHPAIATSTGRTRTPTSCRDLVDRRSFNDLLASVEPGPEVARAVAQADDRPARLRVELVAAEPLVQDPIAFAWGPDGKLWVVEMGDYPLGDRRQGQARRPRQVPRRHRRRRPVRQGDRLPRRPRLPDRRAAVAEGRARHLPPRTSSTPRTPTATARPTSRKVLFTGFSPGNQQHRVNGLVWGLDNWVYCANGDSGGAVTVRGRPARPLDIRGRDFRIQPDTGEIEPTTRPDAVRPDPRRLGQLVRRQQRDPRCGTSSSTTATCAATRTWPPPTARSRVVEPVRRPVFPTSRTLPRFNDPHTANRFTSACGIGILPRRPVRAGLRRALFVCEPVHNLVHRLDLVPDGATFTSRRADDEPRSEFLASADNWFRPAMARRPARTGRCGSPTCTAT